MANGTKDNKIQSIDDKIKALQEAKKKLESEKLTETLKLMKKSGADTLPPEILAGAISDAVEAYTKKKDIVKTWQVKGQTILDKTKKNKGKKEDSFRQSKSSQ